MASGSVRLGGERSGLSSWRSEVACLPSASEPVLKAIRPVYPSHSLQTFAFDLLQVPVAFSFVDVCGGSFTADEARKSPLKPRLFWNWRAQIQLEHNTDWLEQWLESFSLDLPTQKECQARLSAFPCQLLCLSQAALTKVAKDWNLMSGCGRLGCDGGKHAQINVLLRADESAILFCDNWAALDTAVKGSAKKKTWRELLKVWEDIDLASLSWIARVPSKSNVADGPSRDSWDCLVSLGAKPQMCVTCPISGENLRCYKFEESTEADKGTKRKLPY